MNLFEAIVRLFILEDDNASHESYAPNVARLEKILGDSCYNMWIRLKFYRSEQSVGGRRGFHARKEFFSQITMKFRELTPSRGSALVILSIITPNWRTSVLMITIVVFNINLPPEIYRQIELKYCKCEMPINPDKFMVQCDEYEDSYINCFSSYVVIM
ncbi:chromatin remodeling protein EBS-like [Olea europaea var. sylvestris]|uniref:chromatin remodeling protein EBS-like n=1 Tax=Olea europaea var. sylvestris TaxID=158386 RepID=UPI000C1D1F5A|nr:chromatin remodeling protein EBS-like [Olea europaea var. sylvestris]